MPWVDDAAARLAVLSDSTTAAIKNALPAFGRSRGQPARAVTACCLCTAARRISQPVPVYLPAHHQICTMHGIWLSRTGTPQFSVSECRGILAAERQARGLIRRCITEQLNHARIRATQQPGSQDQQASHAAWKQRMHSLITSNPRAIIESCPQGNVHRGPPPKPSTSLP
jgi:hypothetical protein